MLSPMRYMGSKRSLAPRIAGLITRRHPDATVVDAFAGTCAIGTAVASAHRVVANDVHAFAEVIARALLVTPGRVPLPSEAWEELREPFERNAQMLGNLVGDRRDREAKLVDSASRAGKWRGFADFTLEELKKPVPLRLRGAPPLADHRADPRISPYSLFTRYFAGAYVGIQQALDIDSLRFAIDCVRPERRDFYLFALLHALSFCATSPGHFAQFLVPRDEKNTKYIARIRRRSITAYFEAALIAFSRPACIDRGGNRVSRSDATVFLTELSKQRRRSGKLVIYADPPYSRAQYSRYYHVAETLVLYDYPAATGKGRYRDDRFETDFSRKSKVKAAMDSFIEAAASSGAPLYLSYPKNGLLYQAGADPLQILKTHYRKAKIVASVGLNHSTMGAAPGTASIEVTEDVYYAEQ